MIITLIISILTVAGIIGITLIKPTIRIGKINLNTYWMITLLGALLLIIFGRINFKEIGMGVFRSEGISPIEILILFISMTMISIFLDELGFFNYAASYVLKHSKGKQLSIFVELYVFVAILTMFTSNDIIIFTLTPFIIFFSKNAKISPIPYLVSEFVSANTWSMIFLIGNPTNIYISQSFEIDFVSYFKVMALPTIFTGLVEFLILFLLFRKELNKEIDRVVEVEPLKNKFLTIFGLIILSIATIMLVISSYVSIKMYLISLISMLVLMITSLIYMLIRKKDIDVFIGTIKRTSWELIPFVISMFIIVLTLQKYNVTSEISNLFGLNNGIIKYGIASFLSANLFNNIPMSILFTSVLSSLEGATSLANIYSITIGSNLGAFLTPFGALAGIMWMSILKKHEVNYKFINFIKNGMIIAIPCLIVSLLSLYIVLLF